MSIQGSPPPGDRTVAPNPIVAESNNPSTSTSARSAPRSCTAARCPLPRTPKLYSRPVPNGDQALFVNSGSHCAPSMCSFASLAASSGVFPSSRATM
jgi:hypothetical protein